MGKPVGEKQQVGLKFLTLPVKHLEDGVGGDEEQRVGSHIYLVEVDDDADMPFGNGEGRFVAPQGVLDSLAANGQIATQYVDSQGVPSMDIAVNPNGSMCAVEGLFSPDGRVFGKMGHSERRGEFVAKNIPGDKLQPIFESGALYFR